MATDTIPAGDDKRVRLRTLVAARWIAVAGQLMALLLVRFGLDYEFPFLLAVAPVLASGLLNVVVSLRYAASTRLGDRQTAGFLAYDLVQLALLLFLTGGLVNPFSVLMLVPVMMSATILSLRSTLALGVLAALCLTFLALFHLPLPWAGAPVSLPPLYIFGIWVALSFGMLFTSAYAWRVAVEARNMSRALSAAQAALAREQRLSTLDGVAAAAAHELGTPLSTISLVARELSDAVPASSPILEDIDLLNAEAERCREILARLSQDPQEDQSGFNDTTLQIMAEADVAALRADGVAVRIELVPPADGGPQPRIIRRPEIHQGVSNLLQNAADFARSEVRVRISWDNDLLRLEIIDDGPGIPFDILDAIGEPYLTTRPAGGGMGLGVFIAKTLLERTGASLTFQNRGHDDGRVEGATVVIAWPRGILERQFGNSADNGSGEP